MIATHLDRRRNVRYQCHKKVLLIQPSGIHNIRDISFGGLSFCCPRDMIFTDQWPLEIMIAGSLLRVIRVPVRLVREQTDSVVSPVLSPGGKAVGVEYLALEENNRPLLARLISYLQQTTECSSCR